MTVAMKRNVTNLTDDPTNRAHLHITLTTSLPDLSFWLCYGVFWGTTYLHFHVPFAKIHVRMLIFTHTFERCLYRARNLHWRHLVTAVNGLLFKIILKTLLFLFVYKILNLLDTFFLLYLKWHTYIPFAHAKYPFYMKQFHKI